MEDKDHGNMARNEMCTGEPGIPPRNGDADVGKLVLKILGGLGFLVLLLGPLFEK